MHCFSFKGGTAGCCGNAAITDCHSISERVQVLFDMHDKVCVVLVSPSGTQSVTYSNCGFADNSSHEEPSNGVKPRQAALSTKDPNHHDD